MAFPLVLAAYGETPDPSAQPSTISRGAGLGGLRRDFGDDRRGRAAGVGRPRDRPPDNQIVGAGRNRQLWRRHALLVANVRAARAYAWRRQNNFAAERGAQSGDFFRARHEAIDLGRFGLRAASRGERLDAVGVAGLREIGVIA